MTFMAVLTTSFQVNVGIYIHDTQIQILRGQNN